MLISLDDLIETAVLVAVLGAAAWVTQRVQRSRHLGYRARVLMITLSLATGFGMCLVPLRPAPNIRGLGYPLPVAAAQRVDGKWGHFAMSPARSVAGAGVNFLLAAGIIHSVGMAVLALQKRHLH